jgi:TPR repeat protein
MSKLRTILALSIGLVVSAAASADPVEDAQKLRGKDSSKAYAIIKPLADQGNAEAQAVLAGMYNGNEVPGEKAEEAYDMAIYWMSKAAEQGDAEHQALVGFWLLDGTFGQHDHPDPARAIPWLKKAAAQGHPGAMYNLGRAFNTGKGVPENPVEAARWFQQAFDHGNLGVADNLAELYEMGRGVPQDDHRAFTLYLDSAKRGSDTAAQAVAEFYMDGRGVQQDRIEAYAWYTVFAVLSRASDATKVGPRDALAETLSLNEVAEGQRRALELFRPNDWKGYLSEAEALADGNAADQAAAAEMFREGTLVPQNFQKALELFQKLADASNATALIRLGEMYEHGLGVELDLVEAYLFYYVAAQQRADDDAQHDAEVHLIELRSHMSEDLADYARKRAWKWKPKAQ